MTTKKATACVSLAVAGILALSACGSNSANDSSSSSSASSSSSSSRASSSTGSSNAVNNGGGTSGNSGSGANGGAGAEQNSGNGAVQGDGGTGANGGGTQADQGAGTNGGVAGGGAQQQGAPGKTANQNPGSEGYVQVAEDGSWTATEPDGEIVRVYPDGSWDRSNPATGNTDWVGADGSWITNENGLPNGSNKNSQVQPNGTYEVRMNGEASRETPSGTPETPVMPNGSNAVTPKGAVQPAKR
ncbi:MULTISPECIES: 1,4-beta-cellobiosidase [unclassified Rothia (in: high G+C Gram-positive bacteria)]|uniref:1,4-beta-cellobiosidase n=1 Tax=unclassified Rothia (in: high G+C Gram-positive bacteria) TaxID=2689056 RepID=UPI0008A1EA72|nr:MULTISPECIES: 1,4-beta-cellobiosidase [unclassified Rothia (in: high G+C Gram-positive bacteria)]